MKTLDETIESLAFCSEGLCEYCHFQDEGRELCRDAKNNTALYYLKEYRHNRIKYFNAEHAYQEYKKIAHELSEKYKETNLDVINPSLDWEELKTMEGKPIWIEYKDSHKGEWTIIRIVDEDGITDDSGIYPYDQFNKDWSAYRKEKE